jgi:hypothetical protein
LGGCGSGNYWRWDAKRTVNQIHSVDVRYLARGGLLRPGLDFTVSQTGGGESKSTVGYSMAHEGCSLRYEITYKDGTSKSVRTNIKFLTTPCHLGGERTWFQCPHWNCGRRVAVLYCGSSVACRICHNLSYASQNESLLDRRLRKGQKLNRALGQEGWFLKDFPDHKPKGMHKATYQRKCAELAKQRNASLCGFSAFIDQRFPAVNDESK